MIKLVNVSKYYTSKTTIVQALKSINLELNLGEFVAITGESGSGKTTLLNIISGMDTYEDGDVYINDKVITLDEERFLENYRKNDIAFIFQDNNLIDSYTVFKNVETALVIQGLNKKDRINKVKEIIEKVDLTKRIHHRATKLSGGERQRVAIARALAKDAKIIIADEPTGNLDSKSADDILNLLSELAKERLVILVTHSYPQVEKYVTRKIRLFDGAIIEDRIIKTPSSEITSQSEVVKINDFKKSFILSSFNFFGQLKRAFFITLITFGLVFFVFSIYSYPLVLNDPLVEEFNYLNAYQERLIVKRKDNLPLTDADYTFLNNEKRIKEVIKEDIILDARLSLRIYFPDTYIPLEFSGYYDYKLKDVDDDLIIGRKPTSSDEILISTFIQRDDEALTEILNHTYSALLNDYNLRINHAFKVVGIIKATTTKDSYYVTEEARQLLFTKFNNENIQFDLHIKDNIQKIYINKNNFYINSNLTGFNVISSFLYDKLLEYPESNLKIIDNEITVNDHNMREDYLYQRVYVSQEFYNLLFPENTFARNYQYTIHLYNKYDQLIVTQKLNENGYYVYSPFYDNAFNLSNPEALNKYLITMFSIIAVFLVIVIVYLFSYFIYKIVLNSKSKDYLIYKTLGANDKIINITILLEFAYSYLISYCLFFVIYQFIKKDFPILVHYRVFDYILIILINLIMSLVIIKLYLNSLNKKSINTSMHRME